ncbi:MAG: serine/threonine protein phosphatase [Rhodospirillales bacterium]|nr:serine/threonine protein phosphatase [Rhodospirillales bacterium]
MGKFINKLRGGRSGATRHAPSLPDGQRYYVIGDIHGRQDLLETMCALITEDMRTHDAEKKPLKIAILFLGDYVDRGDDSRQVVDYLLSDPFPHFAKIHLKGNHEDALLRFVDLPEIGREWFTYGGLTTLISYGVRINSNSPTPDQMESLQKEFVSNLPAAHLAFFENLDIYHEAGDYVFVHAGILPGRKIAKQRPQDLMWIRDEFLDSDRRHEKFVIHGHSITEAPEIRPNRIGIDTGAYHSNRLTCLVLEADERRFLETS